MNRWGLPAPWSRAPLLLLRRPAVAVAMAVAGLLVALPAAAAWLFLSSSGTATLHNQIERTCQWSVGARVSAGLPFVAPPYRSDQLIGERLFEERMRVVSEAAADVPRLSRPQTTLRTVARVVPASGNAALPDQTRVNLVARDGFREHVRVLAGGNGPGVWLADRFAAKQRLGVGDRIEIRGSGRSVALPVAAVYRDLRALPDRDFWCSLEELYRGDPLSNSPVLPLAFVDRAAVFAVAQDGQYPALHTFEMAVDVEGLTTAEAAPVVAGLSEFRGELGTERAATAYPGGSQTDSALGGHLGRADLVVDALTGTVVPLAMAGMLAGLVIAAAAGAFWVERRRTELTVLSARGVGPAALAGKAVLEAASAVAVGSVLGWTAARFLVAAAGPSSLVTPGALTASVVAAVAAFVAVLAAIAVVAGGRAARLFDARPAHRHRWLRRVPWEAVPLAAAAVGWFVLGGSVEVGGQTGAGTVAHLPPRLIVVPILFAIGLALLAGRVAWWTLSRRRSRAPSASMGRVGRFLAWRRIRAAPAVAAILVGATTVPVALSVFGATVIGSVERTLHAEAQLIVGSDVVLSLAEPAPVPGALRGQASLTRLRTDGLLGDTTVYVLGVDPATFGDAAFWDPALPGPTLDELMDYLGEPGGPRAAGVLTGMRAANEPTLELAGVRQRLDLVTVPQLPGKTPGNPLLLVHTDVLAGLVTDTTPQLWVRGDPDRTVAAVAAAGIPVATTAKAESVHDAGVYTAITYTFTFLAAVSLLSGVIIVVGLLLHLDARSRARGSSYVLLRRMAVTARAHWRALLLEVGGLLLAGFAAGLLTALVVVLVTHTDYDVDPGTMPGAMVTTPWTVLGGLLAAAVITAVVASATAQRAASRAQPSEVLRDPH